LQELKILKCNLSNIKKNETFENKTISMDILEKDSPKNVTFDHDYNFDYNLSQYSKEVVIYISGFIAKKLLVTIQCEDCSSVIAGTKKM